MPDLSSSDLVQRVRDMLGDHPYETTSTTTGTGTTVAVTDGTRWSEGAIGEWQTGTVGYEQFFVQSVAANNLTVIRGYDGTTAETHTSGDRVIRIDKSGFAGRKVQQAINQAILDCWPYVWKTGTVSLTPSTTNPWYNLNTLTLGIVNVVQLYGASSERVAVFKDRYFGGKGYIVKRALPAALVASGNGMYFPEGLFHATNTVTVTDVRVVTGTTDIVDSSNLPVAEALVYGAISRLLRAKEISRIVYGANLEAVQTSSQGSRVQLGQFYETQFRNRIEAIGVRLRELFKPDEIWE